MEIVTIFTTLQVRTCDICGDRGFFESIVTCCECKSSREHLYCMGVFKTKPPAFWCCEECGQKKLALPTKIVKEHEPLASRQNTPTIIQRTISLQKSPGVLKGSNRSLPPGRANFKEKRVNTGKTRYLSCDEAVKLSSGDKKLNCSPRKEFCSAHGFSKSKPPIRERTAFKSSQQERSSKFDPHLQQPVVHQSSGSEGETFYQQERTAIKSPQRERTAIKSPQRERTAIKSPQQERTAIKSTQQERTAIKSPQKERSVTFQPHVQQPIVNQSTVLKAKNEVLSPRKEEADIGRHTEVPKSSKNPEKTDTKSEKSGLLSPSKKDADTARHIEVSTSSIKLVKTDTKPVGSKNVADVEAGISDAGKPNLSCALIFSETQDPYNPASQSYWKGSFYLPNGHEKFNESFKAHPPLSVHCKVYETVVKMPKDIYFELVPKHDVRMKIFLGDCPDKDDIGLYFFPSFKKRSEDSISIMDFLWRENLVMKSYVQGVELFVLSSRVLQPQSQEFQGNYFLWGVFRPLKVSEKVVGTQLLLEAKRETDVPPGFKRIC